MNEAEEPLAGGNLTIAISSKASIERNSDDVVLYPLSVPQCRHADHISENDRSQSAANERAESVAERNRRTTGWQCSPGDD